jgi:hypothetical protein
MNTTDRSKLIRLASALPQGSEDRRAILAGLKRAAPALELLDNLKNLRGLDRAWPNITYKGVPLLGTDMYPFYDVAAGHVTESDFQEVYMGYSPRKDVFVVGFDVWPDESEEDYWDEHEAENETIWDSETESYRAASQRKTASMSAQWVAVKFDGRNSRVVDTGFAPGGFYPGGRNSVKKKYTDIIDLRLD